MQRQVQLARRAGESVCASGHIRLKGPIQEHVPVSASSLHLDHGVDLAGRTGAEGQQLAGGGSNGTAQTQGVRRTSVGTGNH